MSNIFYLPTTTTLNLAGIAAALDGKLGNAGAQTLNGSLTVTADLLLPDVAGASAGVLHAAATTGDVTNSLIVNADITNSTIADGKLASTVSTAATANTIVKRGALGAVATGALAVGGAFRVNATTNGGCMNQFDLIQSLSDYYNHVNTGGSPHGGLNLDTAGTGVSNTYSMPGDGGASAGYSAIGATVRGHYFYNRYNASGGPLTGLTDTDITNTTTFSVKPLGVISTHNGTTGAVRQQIDDGNGNFYGKGYIKAHKDMNDDWLGQVVASGLTNNNDNCSIGFNTSLNYGFLQCARQGDSHRPLKLNPMGGAVTTANNTLDSSGNMSIAGNITGNYIYTNYPTNNNVALGCKYPALTSGTSNCILNNGLQSVTSGAGNIAIGYNACNAITTTSNNIGMGTQALLVNTGTNNIALGSSAGISVTGDNNLFLGTNTGGSLSTGGQNIFIGGFANTTTTGLTNSCAIGYNSQVNTSNTIQLGNTSVTSVTTSGTVTATAFNSTATNSIAKDCTGTANDGQLAHLRLRSATLYSGQPKELYMGVDTTAGYCYLQGIHDSTGVLSLKLQPQNGAVSTYNNVLDDFNGNMTTAGTITSGNVYSVGSITQSGTTINGSSTVFTAAMIGGTITITNYATCIITARASNTQITVDISQTVPGGNGYTVYYGGSITANGALAVRGTVTSSGNMTINGNTVQPLSINNTGTIAVQAELKISGTAKAYYGYDTTNGVRICNGAGTAILKQSGSTSGDGSLLSKYNTLDNGTTGAMIVAGGATISMAGTNVITSNNTTGGGENRLILQVASAQVASYGFDSSVGVKITNGAGVAILKQSTAVTSDTSLLSANNTLDNGGNMITTGTITAGKAIIQKITSVASGTTQTLDNTAYMWRFTGATNMVATLPSAASNPGLTLMIVNDKAANTVTINRAGSDFIDGSLTSQILGSQHDRVTLVSDGISVWYST